MTEALYAPVREKQRIQIIDAIRGVALLGILMMNIPYFSNPFQYHDLGVRNEYSGINYYTWWVVEGVFEGTMRALFSILFGAGCILLLARLEKKHADSTPADIYYRRLLWLLVFGLVNAFLFQWPGDILYTYALAGLFLFPFRKLKPKMLFFFALLVLLFATLQSTYQLYGAHRMRVSGEQALALEKQGKALTKEQTAGKDAWVQHQQRNQMEVIREQAKNDIQTIGKSGWFSSFGYLAGWSAKLESVKLYNGFFFDALWLLFLGMALFKWGVLTGNRTRKFYWLLLSVSYIIGGALSYWQHSVMIETRFDRTQWFSNFYVDTYQLRRTFLALGHLSVLMLLYKYGFVRWFFNALAKVGQMAFSNYLMQTIICTTIFYGFGFGLFGTLERYQVYYVMGMIWIVQIAFSNIWLHYYRFGPFEWVWRNLTYWKKQPMKKQKALEESEGEPGEGPVPAIA